MLRNSIVVAEPFCQRFVVTDVEVGKYMLIETEAVLPPWSKAKALAILKEVPLAKLSSIKLGAEASLTLAVMSQ